MKKVLLFVALASTIGFASCTGNKQAKAVQAKTDSIAEVARLDSIAKAQADSIAATTVDTLQQGVKADTLQQATKEAAKKGK